MQYPVLVIILLLTSNTFASPTALDVATAILQDSGMGDAKELSEIKYTTRTNGTDRFSEHSIKFTHRRHEYSCESLKLTTTPTSPGEHYVTAELSECRLSSGAKLILKNDYTNSRGHSYFRRVFFNDNTKFRAPNDDDEKIVKRRSRQYFGSDAERNVEESLKVLHTNDLEDGVVVIDSTGAVYPIN
jgi:hypothetical protein